MVFNKRIFKIFLTQLVATAQCKQNRVRLIATVRSEFIARLEESEPILQVLNAGFHFHLGPVSPRALQDMIEQPAQATGYVFEPQVINEILREAVSRTWESSACSLCLEATVCSSARAIFYA